MRRLIAFVGVQGAGKNTAAIPFIAAGYQTFSFAAAVKDALAAIFLWPRDLLEGVTYEARVWREQVDPWWAKKLNNPAFSPRWALMHFATDVMRNQFHPEIWVLSLERRLALLDEAASVVVTDCRFANELAMVRQYGGQVYQVVRDLDHRPNLTHVSETEWLAAPLDGTIINDGSVAELHAAITQRFLLD